jgi:hypothetical protein
VSDLDPENTLIVEIPHGRVVIKLRPDVAPGTLHASRNLPVKAFMMAPRSTG